MLKPLFLLALFLGFLSASALGRTTQATYSYDASGRVHTSTDATGLTTLYRYNNLDSPLGVYYPDGTSELTDYTCCALPGMTTDRSGRRSYSDYDQLKRMVRVQDADGQTLQFDYNADGDRVSMLDANGQRTRWAYDSAHRPLSKTYADGTQERWDYVSGANLLAGATNARGARTTFAYSSFDEVAGINYPNTATTSNVSFSYDPLGRKASMTDGIGTSGWSYDGVGRLQGESGPFGNDSLSYSYDSLNRVQSLSIGRDATTSDTESFGYDGLGRLASVSASAGAFGNVGTFGYSYVGNTSLLSQMTRPNGTKTVLSYENAGTANALHRLTGVQDVSATGGNIAAFGYGYDSTTTTNGFVDNRTSQTRSYGSEGAQTISYGYNPTSMLQGEGATAGGASTPALSKSYVFDAMGNRTSATDAVAKTQTTSTYNALNQLTGQSSYSTSTGAAVGTGSSVFGYDGDGNMNSVTAKDATGAVTGQTSYTYDDASRLIGITTPGGSKWQFVYDGFSRLRISRSWNWMNGAWVQNSEVHRVYLGMDVVQERDASNAVTASYVKGSLARSTATGTVFYGYDGSGNVTSLTDATGAVVGSYTYDAWGNTLASSGPKAQENPYRYSSKEQLAGMYCYGFRFYSSGLGRWINRDPIREGGGTNLYEFVENSPTNRGDAYGESSWGLYSNGPHGLTAWTDGNGGWVLPYHPPSTTPCEDQGGGDQGGGTSGGNRGGGIIGVIGGKTNRNDITSPNPRRGGDGDDPPEMQKFLNPSKQQRGGRAKGTDLDDRIQNADNLDTFRSTERGREIANTGDKTQDLLDNALRDAARAHEAPAGPVSGADEGGGFGGGGGAVGNGEGGVGGGEGPGGGGCFAAGTLVLMADGSFKPIEQMKKGDVVLAREDGGSLIGPQKVISTSKHEVNGSIILLLSTKESIETTSEHRFFVVGTGFVDGIHLKEGMTFLDSRNSPVKLDKIRIVQNKIHFVYNFTVDNYHTYFVGRSSIWVHNMPAMKDSGDFPERFVE